MFRHGGAFSHSMLQFIRHFDSFLLSLSEITHHLVEYFAESSYRAIPTSVAAISEPVAHYVARSVASSLAVCGDRQPGLEVEKWCEYFTPGTLK